MQQQTAGTQMFNVGTKVQLMDGTKATVKGYEDEPGDDGINRVRVHVGGKLTVVVRESALSKL